VTRDRGRVCLQRGRERVLVERPHRVVDRERPVGPVAQSGPLVAQLGHAPQRRAEAAQPAGVAHGGRQIDLVPWSERRAEDRNVDTEHIAQRRTNHDGILAPCGSVHCGNCAQTTLRVARTCRWVAVCFRHAYERGFGFRSGRGAGRGQCGRCGGVGGSTGTRRAARVVGGAQQSGCGHQRLGSAASTCASCRTWTGCAAPGRG
jgi:hypothetical protein